MAKKAGQHTPPRRSQRVIPSPAFAQSGIVFSVCGLSIILGTTVIPDKKNYDISELGLSVEAAKNLYTG